MIDGRVIDDRKEIRFYKAKAVRDITNRFCFNSVICHLSLYHLKSHSIPWFPLARLLPSP
jgi:hypothetical protein